jgi:membrane protease YdiL (CAAX protease family)
MNKPNSITAPLLLITAMLLLILFRGVLLNLDNLRYIPDDAAEYGYGTGDYIIYNGAQYMPERFFILTFTLHIFAFILPAALYIKLFKSEGYIKGLNLKLPEIKQSPLLFYALGAVVSGAALLNSLIYYMGGPLELRAAVIDAGGNPIYDISAAAAFVFLPAVCEEFLFRSVISREYARYGAVCACAVSAAAFAALRFSPVLFPVYFLAGVILYITAKASDSVLFAVFVHAGYNFFNIYVWTRLSAVLTFEQNRFIFSFLAAVLFIIFMIALLNKTEKIYHYKAYEPAPMPEGVTDRLPAFRAMLSPTLAAAAIIYFIGISI